ncbi:MAG: hypothetical protein WDZ85_03380 [Candidatus Paceibacterota bacterium]
MEENNEQINQGENQAINNEPTFNDNSFGNGPAMKESKGPTIGIIIIILILVLGGLYVLFGREGGLPTDENGQTEALLEQDSSTELDAIEADALNTELEGLDQELEDLEAEL